jgi:hypothetical protein
VRGGAFVYAQGGVGVACHGDVVVVKVIGVDGDWILLWLLYDDDDNAVALIVWV